MSFRARLLLLVSLAVVATVALATATASFLARRAFEGLDERRTAALVQQFRSEFARRGGEVAGAAERIAASEPVLRMAVDLGAPNPDYAPYPNEAGLLAAEHHLDLVALVAVDGTIVSSAHWPARFGYRESWLAGAGDWRDSPAFFRREELPDGTALALVAVRTAAAGDRKLHVLAGLKLDSGFLSSLVLPEGMRALLYRSFEPGLSPAALSSPVAEPEKLAPLVEEVRRSRAERTATVVWRDSPETFHAIPLAGRDAEPLGVLLVGSSRRDLQDLVRRIRWSGIVAGAGGVLLGLALGYGVAARVTRPVERLAEGARRVASGAWDARVEGDGRDEIGELVRAFNAMTRQLVEQRDRLVQAERVAAWRELARRLAHELKNPLFPLQITIENLARAREQVPDEFEEIFRESTATLLQELQNLKTIVGRFGDFARMPPPELVPVDLNELVRGALRLFEAQFHAPDRPPVDASAELDANAGVIQADADQLRRALENLMLNAADAMPAGGSLRIRTGRRDGSVWLEVSDTGEGLTPEECRRLFTPYYTTKRHGTGLGLAIVQSVVSDHRGRISVESEPGRGTTFRIELPGT